MSNQVADRIAPVGCQSGSWRELVWPREHGSWSLVLEPLVFGMLVAPSRAGAWLASAAIAGFFARRPLRTVVNGANATRRAAARGLLGVLAVVAVGFFIIALAWADNGATWLPWLLPTAVAGAVFLFFDLRAAGREETAEVAGSAAFAFMPAIFATLAGWRAMEAVALALVICGRALPTVLAVRAVVRARKTGERRIALPLAAAGLAVATGVALVRAGLAPRTAEVLLVLLAARATALLVWPRPPLRARSLGILEAVFGAVFDFAVGFAWRG